MDDRGRLHMPGFVGQSFEETGVKLMPKHPDDEAARRAVEGAEIRGADELGMNRKSRRKMASEMMRRERVG